MPARVALTLVALALCRPASADTLTASPAAVSLRSPAARAQLVLTLTTDGRDTDATAAATYASADAWLNVSPGGQLHATRAGTTRVTATYRGQTVTVSVTVGAADAAASINFANQVVPVLTKAGCNSGGCHGKQSGQNGFRVSLLGFEPEFDYMTLVKEGRGRRLVPADPERSPFLLKAVGAVAHGGGAKLKRDSDEYDLLKRWIAAGMPFGSPTDPVVTTISVTPDRRTLGRDAGQQFRVVAHYSDGTTDDVTRQAQYESNEPEVASVEGDGRVATHKLSGEAAVMARYAGHVAVFRATVPLGLPTPKWDFPEQTFIDKHTAQKWRDLGVVPSPLCDDATFLRRVTLDLTGALPTPEQVRAFLADASPGKRDAAIDRLLDSPGYADYFATKWADILRVKRRGDQQRAAGTFAFHDWIRTAVRDDLPYDEFVRRIVTANGHETQNPPVVWFKELTRPDQLVDDVGQVFLGQRLACAQCHHHPYERWSQDDYWGLAAFFGRVGRKEITLPGFDPQRGRLRTEAVYTKSSGGVTNQRRNRPAVPTPLDGEPVTLTADDDPRHVLAGWLTAADNPFFAKAVANRYFAHFMGRGLVDPLDDLRVSNPPSNPELLDALAADLVTHKFSLKALTRDIVRSRTYQLSSEPNEFNRHDKQTYARHYPKRLSAEVLLDALARVTDSPPNFDKLPRDLYAPSRAVQLPDESFTNYFLEVFGRPQRISACECERVNEANLAQSLHLLNGGQVQQMISRSGGRTDRMHLRGDRRSDAEKVDELFLLTLGRRPTAADSEAALAQITGDAKAKRLGYENVLWALVNTKEFLFNR